MANKTLNKAKKAKNDEFYTCYDDINDEVMNYDPKFFKDKTILLPCDDPWESNFFKFFILKFKTFKIRKLIATSYVNSPITKNPACAITWTRKQAVDVNNDGVYNLKDVQQTLNCEFKKIKNHEKSGIITVLHGDKDHLAGDFASDEVTKLRDKSDIIITNPPFSLFRDFLKWCQIDKRKILIIGNINAVTYKEVFPLIKNNKLWLGAHVNKTYYFEIPLSYKKWDVKYTAKKNDSKHYAKVPAITWFTNLDHKLRHEKLQLMTMKENLRFSRNKKLKRNGYLKYDNYNAIEVPAVKCIPSDYKGVMGVPITFLAKYNPDQFKIIGYSHKVATPIKTIYTHGEKYSKGGNAFYITNHGKHIRLYERIVIQAK